MEEEKGEKGREDNEEQEDKEGQGRPERRLLFIDT